MYRYRAKVMSQPSPTLVAPQERQRRDAGLRLDAARFRRELYLRGVTACGFASFAKLSPNTLTRCLNGAPISEHTLRAIVRALSATPKLRGVDELLAPEVTKTSSGKLDALDDDGGSTSAPTAA